jgi:hypothetical protein
MGDPNHFLDSSSTHNTPAHKHMHTHACMQTHMHTRAHTHSKQPQQHGSVCMSKKAVLNNQDFVMLGDLVVPFNCLARTALCHQHNLQDHYEAAAVEGVTECRGLPDAHTHTYTHTHTRTYAHTHTHFRHRRPFAGLENPLEVLVQHAPVMTSNRREVTCAAKSSGLRY